MPQSILIDLNTTLKATGTPWVAVKSLCAFAVKAGDLDLRFVPVPSASEGQAAHQWVQRRRPAHYMAERSVQGTVMGLPLRGRADGYDPVLNQVEEIKTRMGDQTEVPLYQQALHWAQANTYAYLLCAELGLDSIQVALVYVDYLSFKETVTVQTRTREWLLREVEKLVQVYQAWFQQEQQHRATLHRQLVNLPFAFADFRRGQRELARATFQTVRGQQQLLAQAPTGIGKTLAVLYGALRAAPDSEVDRIYFLAARTTGRALALDALNQLKQRPQRTDSTTSTPISLRVLELVGKEKACEHPDKACHPEACPLAKGFYGRLSAARSMAIAQSARIWDQAHCREIALAHGICPYFFTQELSHWADVVVGDYNYYFDRSAQLAALSWSHQLRSIVLVDEAHNLVDRARAMYSAELLQADVQFLKGLAPREVQHSLVLLNRAWNRLNQSVFEAAEAVDRYKTLDRLDSHLTEALDRTVRRCLQYFAEHPSELQPQLRDFMLQAMGFLSLLQQLEPEQAKPTELLDLEVVEHRGRKIHTRLSLRNVIPARHLKAALEMAHATVLFSATLTAPSALVQLLGLHDDVKFLDLPSPFPVEHLQVKVAAGISTRFRDRQQSLGRLVELIQTQYTQRPGNYMVFASSFDYLDQLGDALAQQAPQIPQWRQVRRMVEADRRQYLAQFSEDGQGIGFAVLGGAFGEGVDLPGNRLIGAFIATLGLPQINPVNEAMRQMIDRSIGHGFDRVYLYPGIQKVIQAAGRVIRSEYDRGIIWLVDERYAEPRIKALLPSAWGLGH